MSRLKLNAAGLLILIAALAFSGSLLDRLILNPIQLRKAKLSSAMQEVSVCEARLKSIRSAAQYVNAVADQSAASTASRTRLQYQQWLIDRAQACGITDATVVPISPKQTPFGQRLPFRVEARARQDQVAALLHTIGSSAGLHQITDVQLVPQRDQDHCKIEMGIEALYVPGGKPGRHPLRGSLAVVTPDVQFFRRPSAADVQHNGKRGPTDRRAEDPESTVLQLVAIFSEGERRYAWLLDARNDSEFAVTKHETLVIDSHELQVREIGADYVTIQQHGSRRKVQLGDEARFDPE